MLKRHRSLTFAPLAWHWLFWPCASSLLCRSALCRSRRRAGQRLAFARPLRFRPLVKGAFPTIPMRKQAVTASFHCFMNRRWLPPISLFRESPSGRWPPQSLLCRRQLRSRIAFSRRHPLRTPLRICSTELNGRPASPTKRAKSGLPPCSKRLSGEGHTSLLYLIDLKGRPAAMIPAFDDGSKLAAVLAPYLERTP